MIERDPDARMPAWEAAIWRALQTERGVRAHRETVTDIRENARRRQDEIADIGRQARQAFATLREIAAGADDGKENLDWPLVIADGQERGQLLTALASIEDRFDWWIRWSTIPQSDGQKGRPPAVFHRLCADAAAKYGVTLAEIARFILTTIRPVLTADERDRLIGLWTSEPDAVTHLAARIQAHK